MQLNLPFITWRELPPLNEGAKPRKVPSDPSSGAERDPHDRSWWMTAEQCQTALNSRPELQLRPGVVLSHTDPYFLLDLDDCHDGNDWTEGAKQIIALFPGAAVEVSINGRGLHILGQCDATQFENRRNKFQLYGVECEFYHTKRFIALGHGFTGEPDLNWTANLLNILPVREIVNKLPLIDAADPEWAGPEDDDTLINLMVSARGSTATMFGDKASVADLWTGNVEALAKTYPSVSGDSFDRSSADAALMAHLAFWTGKNTDRMDRLFRRSALMRDKYEKHGNYDYAGHTISGAVANTKNVYKQSEKKAPQREVSLPAGVPTDDVKSAPITEKIRRYGEIMTVDEQTEFFSGCVYIANEHAVLTPSGAILKPATFKTIYGGHCFLMSSDGTKPTYNAFEAFTENRVVRFPKVQRTRFKPQMQFGEAVPDDGVNIYMPPNIATAEGDVTRLLQLLQTILPDERDRTIFMSWLAAVVQYPGVKFLWSPVLQGVEGNGKSIWGEILYYSIGSEHSWTVEAKKIDTQFNKFLSRRIFINVEEMNMFAKHELMETLKGLITGTKQEVEMKGVDSAMDLDYCANWYFATNHKDAVIKSKNDRRFAVFFTAQQTREDVINAGLSGTYFPKLWKWLKKENGFAFMRHYLLNFQIPDEFNPNPEISSSPFAPETTSTQEAVAHSYGAAEQHIIEACEAEIAGFKGGWLSTTRVSDIFREAGIKRSPRKIGSMIEAMGYKLVTRSTRPLMHENNTKPRLYALPHVQGGLDEYETAQGYK